MERAVTESRWREFLERAVGAHTIPAREGIDAEVRLHDDLQRERERERAVRKRAPLESAVRERAFRAVRESRERSREREPLEHAP